jgi:small neutral amino acid transporter SnatA (MarC family)
MGMGTHTCLCPVDNHSNSLGIAVSLLRSTRHHRDCGRLMGMLPVIISVQMFLDGIKVYLAN